MERCPVCKAIYKQKTHCHRCKTDLSGLLAIENQAERLRIEAVKHCNSGNYDLMFQTMKQSYSLKKTTESRKLLACAALLAGEFNVAWSLYLKDRKLTKNERDS